MRERVAKRKDPDSSRWRVLVAARVLLVIGAVDVLSSVFKPLGRRLHFLESIFPKGWPDLATAGSIIVGATLIVLSFGLARRNRAAFIFTELLLLTSAALEILKEFYFGLSLAALILFIWLFTIRDEFYSRPVRRAMTRAIIVFTQITILSLAIGLILMLAPDKLFGGDVDLTKMLQTVFRGLVGLSGPALFMSHREQDVFDVAMLGLGLSMALLPLFALLQPGPPKPHLTPEDESGILDLLNEFGERDSVGYFALREDKSVLWANSRKAAITYRVVGGCALSSGDPIGNPDTWPQVMQTFMQLCRKNGWTPAVVGCSEEAGEIWVRETEMGALEIGDEAIVNVSEYEIESPRYRSVRQSVRKAQKEGYTTSVVKSSNLGRTSRDELTLDARKWRGAETERGFMMGLGRVAEENEKNLLIVTASLNGSLRGILQFVPWGEKALSLDLMRRSPQAHAGVTELLIDATISYARENGIAKISLNFAAFRSVFERGAQLGAGPVIKSWRGILLFFSRWVQMESLYRFNSKFRPDWVPRYVLFRKTSELPKIGLAIMRAEAFIGARKIDSKKTTSLG